MISRSTSVSSLHRLAFALAFILLMALAWQAALEAFRHQAADGDAHLLLQLLADSDWWVRQLAADALVALPGIAEGELTQWQAGVDDRYGRDALARAMAGGHR